MNSRMIVDEKSKRGATPVESERVVIMAGGTGGHIYPGLALAKEFHERGYEIHWLGSLGGMEATLVPSEAHRMNMPIHMHEINISGVRGKNKITFLLAPLKIYKAIQQAKTILRVINPKLVLGMGGFAAGPGGMAAKKLNIPLVIHEQNAVPGTTNRLLRKHAAIALEAFPGALTNATHIGNPVRKEIEEIETPESRFSKRSGPINVVVLGGSRGAQAVNELVPAALKKIDPSIKFKVIHQAGKGKKEETVAAYSKCGVSAEVVEYVGEIATVLVGADLAICRSGALTVSELAAAGVPAIFIPFPFAIDDHQTKNAEYLVKANAARILQQSSTSPEILAVELNELMSSRDALAVMAAKARGKSMPKAGKKIADMCEELINV